MKDGEGEERPRGRLDGKAQAYLGSKLKSAYQELIEAPVPDKFLELLAELSRKENEGKEGGATQGESKEGEG